MKQIFSLLFALFLIVFATNINAQLNQDWKWSHPGPQGNTLRWVKMIDSVNWYAAGYAGTFMKSSNAGSSWTFYTNAGGWQPSYYGQGRILYSGWFFNLTTGLVCGSSGWIARTTNAGLTWDSLASPVTAALYGIHFINSTTGYIGGASGTVLKSTNAGVTWTALTTGVTTTIYNIFAGDNFVLAPTTAGNVRYSTDAGATWATSYTGSSYTVYDVNFIDENTGMTCGSSGNAKITTNGGLNWTAVTTPTTTTKYEIYASVTNTPPSTPYSEGFESTTFPPTGWRSVSVLGTNTWTRSTSYYHSGTASAYISYESAGGDDWLITPKWNIASGDSIAFWWKNDFSSAYPPDSLFVKVSTTDSNVASFTTTILALNTATAPYTWTRYAASLGAFAGQNVYIGFRHINTDGNGGYLDDVAINRPAQTTPTFYVVGDSYGIYKTVNNGAAWTLLEYNDANMPWTSTHYTLDVSGNRIFSGGAYGLLQKSTNAGANFSCLTSFLSPGTKNDVWAQYNNGKVIVVGAPGSTGATFDQILYSTNGGTTWSTPTLTNSISTFYDISMLNANTGFIAGSNGSLRKTTNGGTVWDSVAGPFGTNLLRAMEFVNSTTGYLFQSTTNNGTAWKTTDGGSNWTAISTGTNDSRIYSSCFINANTGYVGNYTPKLMKTTDGGANWTVLTNTPMGSGFIYGIKFFGPDSGYACGSSAARLCRTVNGGTSFDTVPQPFAASLYTMNFSDFQNGWIFGANGFAGRTSSGGASWVLYNTAGSTPYGCYMTNTDSGFVVGTSAYVHKISKAPVSGIEWTPEIPTAYTLKQNYPNPFNPTTTIEFAIPKSGLVSLKIYDVAGREITSALNTMLNPGVIKYTFSGSNYSSGVYFYRLVVDGKVIDTKKMVLIK